LAVKILNRAFKLSAQNPSALTESSIATSAAGKNNNNKQLWPGKTKIFVDQALREQEDPKSIILINNKISHSFPKMIKTYLQKCIKILKKDFVELISYKNGRRSL